MSLLKMSLSGTLIILAVIIIRSLLIYKLPKRLLIVFWDMALIRLLIPFYIPAAWSMYSLVQKWLYPVFAQNNTGTVVSIAAVENGLVEGQWHADALSSDLLSTPVMQTADIFFWSWNAVWIFGLLLVTALFALAYVRCYRELKKSIPVHTAYTDAWLAEHTLKRHLEVRYSDRIPTPLSYGVLKPVILMPKSADWEDEENLRYVLAHEYVHIRHYDAVMKLLLITVVCIHWFNPFVWIMYILANRDIELACDESVIRMFGKNTRKAYAMALICYADRQASRMAQTGKAFASITNNFNKNAIEVRIDAIMKMKKRTVIIPILTTLVMLCTLGLFATSARADSEAGSMTGETFSFHLSELNSAHVQEKLREEGINTESRQYQAVIDSMLHAAEADEREAYTNISMIKILMKNYDEDGDFVNPVTGVAGMDITGKDPASWHKIVSVPEKNRQEMFDNAKKEFMRENGIANGDTTRRSDVFTNYQKSVPKEDRLMGTWTLEQYERQYNTAFYSAAKAADPSWEAGMPIPAGALDGITRESIDDFLVTILGEYGETFIRQTDIAIEGEEFLFLPDYS